MGEAPRDTLFHRYEVDRDGVIQWVNLLIATGQNNLALQLRSAGSNVDRVVVACYGNTLRRDDGIGWHWLLRLLSAGGTV